MIGIVDGYTGEPNIYADDIGEYNISVWGEKDCVLPVGNKLAYTLVSNNEIKIKDGIFVTQGRRGLIKRNTTETARIENGSQGMKRHDLIVIEYSKDNSSTKEKHSLKVIKGTAAAQAKDPAVRTGNIRNGNNIHQMPLYRVVIDGLNVKKVEKMFDLLDKPLRTMVRDCFQSVSDGKKLLASAITDKKVLTDAAATFAQMAANIKKIVLGSGNAVAADVLQGKTFTNDDGVQYTGTMPNIATEDGIDICPDQANYVAAGSKGAGVYARMNAGAHIVKSSSGFAELFVSEDKIRAGLGITASKIIQGQSIAGVAGTAPMAAKAESGSGVLWVAYDHHEFTANVTFKKPFSRTPTINFSAQSDRPGECQPDTIYIKTKSAAGFTIANRPENNGYATINFQWNATA